MVIDIIGGGVGGLTVAIALGQKGFDVRVYEQTEVLKPVGAGIILANNAMQVYEKLGLRETIAQQGSHISSMNIVNPDLKPFSKIDLTWFEKKYQVKSIAIHRGRLQEILLDQLKPSQIHLNHKLTEIKNDSNELQLVFNNSQEVASDMLIGADGINSIVRQLMPMKYTIRKANQFCWRGIADFDLPISYQGELNEAWGKGNRFGFVQIAPKKTYWYALKSFNSTMGKRIGEELSTNFGTYNSLVNEVIASTPTSQIHTAEIMDLKPNSNWFSQNMCLLGDAAHATTPNMGQGACQAIEDAYVIARCMEKYGVNHAFKYYQKLRMTKANMIVSRSWTLGKLAHLHNPFFIGLRNLIMKSTPNFLNRKQTDKIFQLADL